MSSLSINEIYITHTMVWIEGTFYILMPLAIKPAEDVWVQQNKNSISIFMS